MNIENYINNQELPLFYKIELIKMLSKYRYSCINVKINEVDKFVQVYNNIGF